MRVLVFGHNGQTGFYLERLVSQKGWTFYGSSRSTGSSPSLIGDVSDYSFVKRVIVETSPDWIINLAAYSNTKHRNVLINHLTIDTGNLNVLEAAHMLARHAKVFVTGSGLQFRNSGKPISHTDEFEARDPYSMARIASVYQARYYRRLGIKAYVGYLFHHESALRQKSSVSQIILGAAREGISVRIGDLGVVKEWTFAGDVAEGILTLMSQDVIMEATIGSGIGHSIMDWAKLCYAHFDMDWMRFYQPIPGYIPEFKILISNPTVINGLGWKPKVDFKDLIGLMLQKPTNRNST